MLYRFSPIKSESKLLTAINYVAVYTTKLCKKITKRELPIESITIFSHYPNEFTFLKESALKMGTLDHENNGPFVKLHSPIKLLHNKLTLVRIRKPDPYRMQVGCCDFNIENYQSFRKQFISSKPDSLRSIVRLEYEMLEFHDPDFDVLAYVVGEN